MMGEIPKGTVTFLFSDIEGSTRLLDELGADAYSAALADHRRVLRDALTAHGGVEVDTQGDAFFVAFADPPAAVRAAADAQRQLAGGRVRVRMGLHTGQPHLTTEGYVGHDVHMGARIAAAGHGGQVLLSKQTRMLVDDDVLDLGEHRLKDFAAPVWIFQLGTKRFPPLKTISNTNLPRPASSFIGREREVTDVRRLIADGSRLVTLTGPGGSGKTRLAIEAASELVGAFRNGVFWIPLAAIRDDTLVIQTVAQTLGARDNLAEHVNERQMLLLLDNFEQVADAAPDIASLLSACPNLAIIVTSRELLRVRGEVQYAVPPLAEREAVELFERRSQVAADQTVAELCRRLDYLPLAVELAAARAAVLSPAQILERLSVRLDLLKGGRDLEARQQTLRATIEWSHDLLSQRERTLFARLAVFAGGCTLEAAERVADADIDTLQSLVDKSLVLHSGERFWMLQTIREFASERLEGSGEAHQMRRRHADLFLNLARVVRRAVGENRSPRSYDILQAENDNIRATVAWLLDQTDRPAALAALRSLWLFWLTRGYVAEGDHWATQILAMPGQAQEEDEAQGLVVAGELARFVGDLPRAAKLKTEALGQLRETDEEMYAATARDLAIILIALGDATSAERFAREALEIQTEHGTPECLAHALQGMAYVEWHQGRRAEAIALLQESVAKWEECDDSIQIAEASESLADFLRRSGRLASARANLERATTLAVQTHDLFASAWCLRGFGSLLADEGDAGGAARVWGATASAVRESGMSFAEMPSDYDEKLTQVRRRLGDAEFERIWSEGASMSREDALRYVLG